MASFDVDQSHCLVLSKDNQISYYSAKGTPAQNLTETIPKLSEINVQSVHAGEEFSLFVSQEQAVYVVAHSARKNLNSVLGFHPADAFRVGELYSFDYLNYKIKRGGLKVRLFIFFLSISFS